MIGKISWKTIAHNYWIGIIKVSGTKPLVLTDRWAHACVKHQRPIPAHAIAKVLNWHWITVATSLQWSLNNLLVSVDRLLLCCMWFVCQVAAVRSWVAPEHCPVVFISRHCRHRLSQRSPASFSYYYNSMYCKNIPYSSGICVKMGPYFVNVHTLFTFIMYYLNLYYTYLLDKISVDRLN